MNLPFCFCVVQSGVQPLSDADHSPPHGRVTNNPPVKRRRLKMTKIPLLCIPSVGSPIDSLEDRPQQTSECETDDDSDEVWYTKLYTIQTTIQIVYIDDFESHISWKMTRYFSRKLTPCLQMRHLRHHVR